MYTPTDHTAAVPKKAVVIVEGLTVIEIRERGGSHGATRKAMGSLSFSLETTHMGGGSSLNQQNLSPISLMIGNAWNHHPTPLNQYLSSSSLRPSITPKA
jgi:hypothetical protein